MKYIENLSKIMLQIIVFTSVLKYVCKTVFIKLFGYSPFHGNASLGVFHRFFTVALNRLKNTLSNEQDIFSKIIIEYCHPC